MSSDIGLIERGLINLFGKNYKTTVPGLAATVCTPIIILDQFVPSGRAKWGLKADYPMVAPEYAAARSQLAKDMGLGRKTGTRLLGTTKKKAA